MKEMKDNRQENTPNAAKLIDSLRHVGYDSYAAIADLLDNSLDANASLINVSISNQKNDIHIEIVDNGEGMDLDTLDQALRLGSEITKDPDADLGRFGMGLITASLSICKRIDILTRQAGGPILFGEHDVEQIKRSNRFLKECRAANDKEMRLFESKVGKDNSGTVLILSQIDHVSNRNITQLADRLRKKVSQTHRYFLDPGVRKLYINSKEAKPIDPLWLDNGAEVFSDDRYAIKFSNGDGEEIVDEIRVRLVELPPMSKELAKETGVNQQNQGLNILRNNREIMTGTHLGLWVKHPDLNRFRGEIFFSGALDDVMGLDFAKREVNPNQAIVDKLREIVRPQAYTIKRRIAKNRVRGDDSGVSHEDAARLISRKAKLLLKPRVEKEIRPGKENRHRSTKESGGKKRSRTNLKNSREIDSDKINVCFETASIGKEGPIFSADQEGKMTIIQWNIDHPFYDSFIVENKDNRDLISAADFLVYSMAVAELRALGDEEGEWISTVKTIISTNMRVLLS